jgi:hypothetical protein
LANAALQKRRALEAHMGNQMFMEHLFANSVPFRKVAELQAETGF